MMSSLIALAAAQVATKPPPIRTMPSPPPIIRTVPPAPPIMIPVPPAPTPPPPAPPSTTLPMPARQRVGMITSDDYPAAAIRAGEQGTARIRFVVDANGRVSSCEVTESSGSAVLDSASCALTMRRFRFQPATRDGVPIQSVVTRRITWRLPEDSVMRFAQGRFAWTVTASPTGTTACTLELVGTAFSEFDEGNCRVPADAWLVDEEELEAGHPPVRVTQILSLLPQGEALALPPLAGTPFWEQVAEIEITPGGQVSACTIASEHGELPRYVRGRYQPLCAGLMTGTQFAPGPDSDVRRARIQSALYIEVLQPERR